MFTPRGTVAINFFFLFWLHQPVFFLLVELIVGKMGEAGRLMEARREEAAEVPAAPFQPRDENERHGLVMDEDDHVETFSIQSSSE